MPRGEPLDDDPREAARITDRDEAEAKVWARENLPAPFTRLGESEPISADRIKELRREHDLPEL